MKMFQKIIQGITLVLIIVFVFISLLSLLSSPESKGIFGYKGYTVLSGSMESVLTPGDFIIVKEKPYQTIKKNDVITFEINDKIVTHRVVNLSDKGLTTKGDANSIEDSDSITAKDYIGTLQYNFPYIGQILLFLKNPYMIAMFVAVGGIYLIFNSLEKKKK